MRLKAHQHKLQHCICASKPQTLVTCIARCEVFIGPVFTGTHRRSSNNAVYKPVLTRAVN